MALKGMSEEELRSLPVSFPAIVAGRALFMGETKSRELIRSGRFPITVLPHGNRHVCRKVDLLAYLGLDPEPSAESEATSLAS